MEATKSLSIQVFQKIIFFMYIYFKVIGDLQLIPLMFMIVWIIMIIACNLLDYFFSINLFRGGLNSNCSAGYYGPLCSVCVYNDQMQNYKITDTSCVQCPNIFANLVIILLLLLVIICFLILIIRCFHFFTFSHYKFEFY